jgi:hypothetical protein
MMMKIKPANIFDFYAPTGGATKIADFKMSNAVPNSIGNNPNISVAHQMEFPTNKTVEVVASENKIKWGYWIFGGIFVLGTTAFLIWYYSEGQKRKRRERED